MTKQVECFQLLAAEEGLVAASLRLRVPIVVWKSRATMGCEGPNGALAKLRGADLFVLSHLVEFCRWLV